MFLLSYARARPRSGCRTPAHESQSPAHFYWLSIWPLLSDFLIKILKASTPALRPTQPPIQLVPGAISLGVKAAEA
jgi:hypothetical protein